RCAVARRDDPRLRAAAPVPARRTAGRGGPSGPRAQGRPWAAPWGRREVVMRYPGSSFDLDATLIESFPAYADMHRRIAADLGWRVPSVDELIHYGPTWEDTLARLWPGVGLDPFMDRYEQVADEHPYPAIAGVSEALTQLRGRGHSLWIV